MRLLRPVCSNYLVSSSSTSKRQYEPRKEAFRRTGMLQKHLLISVIIAVLAVHGAECQSRILACFYNTFSQVRPIPGTFIPGNIDAKLCTHIIVLHAIVNDSRLIKTQHNEYEIFAEVVRQKQTNPDLKILLCIGGEGQSNDSFSKMVATDDSIDQFVDETLSYVRRFMFDGVVIKWMWPTFNGSPDTDKERFTALLERMLADFKQEAEESRRERLILSTIVSAKPDVIEKAFEGDKIHWPVDFLIIHTTDFHDLEEEKIGPHSPLYPAATASKEDAKLCIDWAVREWTSFGVPRSKVIITVAAYGSIFQIPPMGLTIPGTPTGLRPAKSPYTLQEGTRSYYEICHLLRIKGWSGVWMADSKVPYAFGPDRMQPGWLWVSYDNRWSLDIKAKYVTQWGLRGIALLSLDLDDFQNACGEGPYPLTKVIREAISPGKLYVEPTFAIPPNDATWCVREGIFPDPSDCRRFYRCANAVLYRFSCEKNHHFHAEMRACVNESFVPGCGQVLTTR